VDFHLHDKQERRKQNTSLRHSKPKHKERLGKIPVTVVMPKEINGTIPKRASHRKQEQQAQPDKNYSNDFVVQIARLRRSY